MDLGDVGKRGNLTSAATLVGLCPTGGRLAHGFAAVQHVLPIWTTTQKRPNLWSEASAIRVLA
jgi:hypothetical protein